MGALHENLRVLLRAEATGCGASWCFRQICVAFVISHMRATQPVHGIINHQGGTDLDAWKQGANPTVT
jgi:hypothetical protein